MHHISTPPRVSTKFKREISFYIELKSIYDFSHMCIISTQTWLLKVALQNIGKVSNHFTLINDSKFCIISEKTFLILL